MTCGIGCFVYILKVIEFLLLERNSRAFQGTSFQTESLGETKTILWSPYRPDPSERSPQSVVQESVSLKSSAGGVEGGGKSVGMFSGVGNRPVGHCLSWKWLLRIECSLYSSILCLYLKVFPLWKDLLFKKKKKRGSQVILIISQPWGAQSTLPPKEWETAGTIQFIGGI